MNKSESVSVVIPVYNRKDTLRDAVESVFRQTLKPSEIIVVNDGSFFDYNLYLSNYLDRIKLINLPENKGVSYARNIGINASSAKYIAFLDSDDLFLSNKLENQLKFMVENNYKISHTNEFWYRNGKWINQGKTNNRYGGNILDKILDKCRISPSSLMVHRNVFEKNLFKEDLRVCEDYELSLRLALQYEIGYFDKKLIIKRAVEENSLSASINHIEWIRYNILNNFYCDYKNSLKNYKEAVEKEIDRKKSIIDYGISKKLNK